MVRLNNINRRNLLTGAAAIGVVAPIIIDSAFGQNNANKADVKKEEDIAHLPRKKIELVAPPFVHAHEQATNDGPSIIEVTMTCEEKLITLDDQGTKTWAMTFNGSVPGPLLVVHEGDYVELTLINPATNLLTHNIDFHASTGAMGGGSLTQIAPGEKTILRFKTDRAGTFVYHCAAPGMAPWHVTSGMNGAIMVLPRQGLNDGNGNKLHYDKVYYIGEQDFYIPKDKNGKYKEYDNITDSYEDTLEVMRGLIPSHLVFNGSVGALTGKNALTANVGETVLFVHSQANRDTRPHLIGGHGDFVWNTGKFANTPERNMETWFIPGGAAGAALYTFKQPGTYVYLNHNLIEAFELGALAQVKVTGEWNDELMKQVLPATAI
ncbi:copper-containing nitrite reductase [Bartonella sp. HY329]|uniref:copper-containing nitrite reductase n=1 Tax=unclassified Bartonella TaxID=2645622 RepID=UPI0021C868FC|nr:MULTISPECIES: copper-containing nitrite reductase [unclassified Bartonella]UXM94866.1 copper-containing nitrite reductase [Bartonella sp. HY329]UXN09189.1 copper-containing nitrite reductase [Bartonella sp. HY328]